MMNNPQKIAQNISGVKSLLAGLALVFASTAFANTDVDGVTYDYIPADALKSSIQDSLSAQQIDYSNLEIDVDDKGTVNVSGNVTSKEAANAITKVIKEKQGVYMLFSRLNYPSM